MNKLCLIADKGMNCASLNKVFRGMRLLSLWLIVSFSIVSKSNAQKYQYKTWNVLDSNHGNDVGFKSIMGAASKARVFFLGENHSQSTFNTRMEYTMMRALYENCGYKNLIIELSPTTAYYMQRYICDNDTNARKILNINSAHYYMTYFDYLHKWQQGIPKEKRIKIHGIDVERFNELPMHRLAEIFEIHRNNIPKELTFHVLSMLINDHDYLTQGTESEITEKNEFSGSKWIQPSKGFSKIESPKIVFNVKNLDSIYKYQSLLASWLGETDFTAVSELFSVLHDFDIWNGLEATPQQYLWREDRMYRNLKSLLQNNPMEKYFGQFGRCHTQYNPREGDCGWYNYSSTAKKLTQGYFNKDESKVLTIGIFYRGIENNNTYNDANSDEDGEQLEKEVKRLVSVSEKNVIVADLKDTLQGFSQLAKKFHYAFVSAKNYPELLALDSNTRKQAEYLAKFQSEEENNTETNYEIGIVGMGYNNWEGSSLTHQLNMNAVNSSFKNLNEITYQCHLSSTKKFFAQGLDFNYQFNKNLCSDNSGNYNYSALGLNYNLGLNLEVSKLRIKILGEMGWVKQMLDYESVNVNLVNPTNLLNRSIASHILTGGGQLRIDYVLNFHHAIGLKARYGMTLNSERWYYSDSEIKYADFGKGLSIMAICLSYTYNFIKS